MNLDELKQTRRRLRGVEAAAASAVQRAEKEVADELFNVRECERPVEAARDREAYDAAAIVLESARKDHALALKRLTDRQGEAAHAEMEARTAEAMVVRAVDEMLDAEREELAAQIERLYGQVARLVAELREATPHPLHTPVNVPIRLSPQVQRALSRVPPRDDLYVSVNELRAETIQLSTVTSREPWAARRRRLIAGEVAEEAAA
jgi:hypothetical protein